MKKFLYLLLFIPIFIFAQDEDNGGFDLNKKTVIHRKGQFNFSPYIGFPHIEKAFFKLALEQQLKEEGVNFTNIDYSGVNPIGARFEYFLNDNLGVGLDFIYNSYTVNFKDTYEYFDFNLQDFVSTTDVYSFKTQRIRLHLRANYHFDVSNPFNDFYLGAGIGYNHRNYNFLINNNIDYQYQKEISDSSTVFPFSARVCFGYKRYFNNNIGFSTEVGLGGPLFSVGLAVKF
jgi:opacity protein-like surface antigen